METFIDILAIIFGIVGIVGSIAPALPGLPLSWVGMLVLYIWGAGSNGAGDPMTTKFLLIWLGIVIVVSLLDYVVPAYFTKLTGGSKYGSWGAVIGLFVGLIYPPIGMIMDRGITVYVYHLKGNNHLEKMLKAIVMGDFVSLYLAHLNGVDPSTDDIKSVQNFPKAEPKSAKRK